MENIIAVSVIAVEQRSATSLLAKGPPAGGVRPSEEPAGGRWSVEEPAAGRGPL